MPTFLIFLQFARQTAVTFNNNCSLIRNEKSYLYEVNSMLPGNNMHTMYTKFKVKFKGL